MKGPLFKVKGTIGKMDIDNSVFDGVGEIVSVEAGGEVTEFNFKENLVKLNKEQQAKVSQMLQSGVAIGTVIQWLKAALEA
ncbi:hypothetical protein [Kordiimonas lacus]|uniref:Uncharacterized protein n=1 Tax=Kordiimonas lacus TaxID=637679 RepID=A0A1G7B0P7_9PROT|nr:hypothetical protein [Kordiimonas lacus]SDE20427.1 hypothetical protein SAMN04488071_2297 [Kordiimonas lacus]